MANIWAKRLVHKAVSTWQSMTSPTGSVPVRSSLMGWVSEPFAGAWQRGVTADPLGAITAFSAVYACVTRIANDIAKLQPRLMEQQEDKTWRPAPDASPHWLVLRRPNSYQNRIQFYTAWLTYKLLYGNAYAVKERDDRNMVRALYLLDPRRVTPMVTPEGDVYYSLGGDDLSKVPTGMVVPAREMIHDRCVTLWHPLIGVSPIYACAMTATQGMRIQNNSATFFENMSRPSGILTAPGTIEEPTAARLKADWERNFSGNNIGKLAVLGNGLTYEAMTIPAREAELIDQLKWTVEDVARAFGMPLYKIGAGPMPTSNNVESLHQQYYADCLQVHIEAIELCLDEGLATPTGYGVEFDLDGLLRMDSATQIEMLGKAVGSALLSPNEARAKLNYGAVAGGEVPFLQEQNWPIRQLASRELPTREPTKPKAPAASDVQPSKTDDASKDAGIKAAEAVDALAVEVRAVTALADERSEAIRIEFKAMLDQVIASVPDAVAKALPAVMVNPDPIVADVDGGFSAALIKALEEEALICV